MNEKEVKDFTEFMKQINESIYKEMKVPSEMLGLGNSAEHMANFLAKTFASIMDTAGSLFEDERKTSVTENETDMMADDARDWGYDYILSNYNKADIQDMGSSIYQEVSEKVYQYVRDTIINEYDFTEDDWDMMYDALADIVYERIDFTHVWEAIDEVLNAPVTFEEKLAEIGMSVRDFL